MKTLDYVSDLHNCLTSLNPPRVYKRLCKHVKGALLLKSYTLILKFKLHMLAKISIIAGLEKKVSSFVQYDRRLAKLPITIKNFQPAERVYNLKKYVTRGVLKSIGLHQSLLSATDEIQQDLNRGIAWTTKLIEPPTVTEEPELLTVQRKPEISHIKQWRPQHGAAWAIIGRTISELLPEQSHKAIS